VQDCQYTQSVLMQIRHKFLAGMKREHKR